MFHIANAVFSSIEANTRKTLGQRPHTKKLNATERRISLLSSKRTPSDTELQELRDLISRLSKEKKEKAQKRVHASLVSGGGMKRAMAAFSNTMAPPIALTDSNGVTVSDPDSVCSLMSSTLLNLGGDVQQTVPPETEQKFLSKVETSDGLPQLFPPNWEEFQTIIRRPKPTKATGLDNLNLYLLSILPDPIQHFIHKLILRVWDEQLPDSWKEAEIFLLPKGGNPTNPSNYRPIALLGAIYKIISTHSSNYLNNFNSKFHSLHPSQFGFRHGYQTADHAIALASKRTRFPNSYCLYLDLSKAFNSVIHDTLFRILEKRGFPPSFISVIRELYRNPKDTPRVNGHRKATHTQSRGLRQGCPLSPSLFALYIDPLLHHLNDILSNTQHTSMHAFADDIAIHSVCPKALTSVLRFMAEEGEPYGLKLNLSKTEVHAWGSAPPVTLAFRAGGRWRHISTHTQDMVPHSHYKYLGVFFFTKYDDDVVGSHVLSAIDAFFTGVPDMTFSPKEGVRMVNTLLLPKIAYRLIAHCLSETWGNSILCRIWHHFARVTRLPRNTPRKARYGPRSSGSLGLFHTPTRIASLTLTQYQRHLYGEGPPLVARLFREALAARPQGRDNYSIRRSYVQAAEQLGCRVEGLSPQVPIANFLRPVPTPLPPPLPTDNLLISRSEHGVSLHAYTTKPTRPRQQDLILHGCGEAATLLASHPDIPIGYADGSSRHPKRSGFAAVIDDPTDDLTLCYSSRGAEEGAYPSELNAINLLISKADPDKPLLTLSDCSAAIQKVKSIISNTCIFYTHTHATILRKIHSAVQRRTAPTHIAHIRSHVGFVGNEWADIFAKRGAYLPLPPPTRPPPYTLMYGSIPITGKPHFSIFRHLIPIHAHNHLHPNSFDLWVYSSFFSKLSYSWPNGLVSLPQYEPFFTMDERNCSLCNGTHAMDPLSCLTYCSSLSGLRDLSFDVWHVDVRPAVKAWFLGADREDQRKFIRTLLPTSLIDSIPAHPTLSTRDLLAHRKKLLPQLVKDQHDGLKARPAPPDPSPKGPVNLYITNNLKRPTPIPAYRPPASIPNNLPILQPKEKKGKRPRSPVPGTPRIPEKRPKPNPPPPDPPGQRKRPRPPGDHAPARVPPQPPPPDNPPHLRPDHPPHHPPPYPRRPIPPIPPLPPPLPPEA